MLGLWPRQGGMLGLWPRLGRMLRLLRRGQLCGRVSGARLGWGWISPTSLLWSNSTAWASHLTFSL